jgi:predicted Zn-dependent peptidase
LDVQNQSGIQTLVLPSKKFKTVRIDVHFLKYASIKDLAQRSLIANILETSTAKYPDQVQFTHALSEMFGASFGGGASKKGNMHDVAFSMVVANDKYIDQQNLIQDAIRFLNEVIVHPLANGNRFDEETFRRQKQNMLNYVKSATEDKQFWSAQQLRRLTFGQEVIQGVPSYGLVEDLESLQNEETYQAYLDMIKNDLVHISVSGDVDEEVINEDLKIFELEDRQVSLEPLITYFTPLENEITKVEHQDVRQARLNLSFNIPAYLNDENFFSAVVFNSLFGGSPQSKLFVNVREKASLAYYASSSLDLYDGILNIQTGINSQNHDAALQIIQQQLDDMQSGAFTEKELANIKKGLRSNYLSGMDMQRTAHRRGLNDYLLNRHRSSEQWLEQLDAVSKKNVEQLAQQVKIRAEYFLSGE